MNLTLEQKKKLAAVLGECWHEGYEVDHSAGIMYCESCSEYVDIYNKSKPLHPNFNDWRIVGRLIEKSPARITVVKARHDGWGCWIGESILGEGSTPQEAICYAVLAWIERKK